MGKWLELFRTLKNLDQSPLTDSDTSRHTAPCVNDRPHPHDRSPHLDVLTHEPVCHGVSLSVRPDGSQIFGDPVFDRGLRCGRV